jgi:arylsulfatase A-like enzyme
VEGVDLAGFLRGAEPAHKLLAYSHTSRVRSDLVQRAQSSWSLFAGFFPSTDIELIWVAVRDGDWIYKLRNTDGERFDFELFDLASDPSETRNLFDDSDPLHRQRARQLEVYKTRLVASHHAAAVLPELTRSQLQRMRSLGYVQ